MKNLRKEIEKMIEGNKEELVIFLVDLREKIYDVKINELYLETCKDGLYATVIEIDEDGEDYEWSHCYDNEEIIKNVFKNVLVYFNYFTLDDMDSLTWLYYNKEVYVKDEVIEFLKNRIKKIKEL